MDTDLPTYISIDQAVAQFNLPLEVLHHDLEAGNLRAVKTPKRGILIAKEDIQVIHKREAFWKQVEHLDGKPIGVREARQKYQLGSTTLNRWVQRGIVRVLQDSEDYGPGKKKLLNERDVAYMGLVADERGRSQGKRILVPEYLPPHLRQIRLP
jgi:hypothetical protein